MRYRDLDISFTIGGTRFTIISFAIDKLTNIIPMHTHSRNSFELHFIPFGRGSLNCRGKKYGIAPGTLFMTGPGVPHEQISDPDDPMTEYCVYMRAESAGRARAEGLTDIFLSTDFWFGTGPSSIYDSIKLIFTELDGDMPGKAQMISALTQQLIIGMIRLYERDKKLSQGEKKAQQLQDLSYLIIEEAFLYDYKTISLESLAQRLGLGRRQTERLLLKHYSKTFREKKAESRMSAAKTLLSESKKNISEISEELGYSSCEHFSSSFKKYCGMTPGEYRKARS